MLPTLAIVGRPNVGKSTLFNVLTRTRDAIVADQPGLTRDRLIGRGRVGELDYWLVDTGGLYDDKTPMTERITQQTLLAVQQADSVLFLVDGRAGLTSADQEIAQQLRQLNASTYLLVNKTESLQKEVVISEFHQLGLGTPYPISASHKQGIEEVMGIVLSPFAQAEITEESQIEDEDSVEEIKENDTTQLIKIAVVGRPNVGKSTLVNRILGEERVITFDQPGTTRDSIAIPFTRGTQEYLLIDTAGIRRRAKVYELIEKFSVIKSLQAIDKANVIIMLLDAREGITEQDATLLGTILESGKALVIAVNKWDGLEQQQREQVRYHLSRRLHFIDFADIHFISALHGSGVGHLFDSIQTAWQSACQPLTTSRLNHVLQEAVNAHPPPLIQGRRIKLRYMHQGGNNPPLFIIHGNQVEKIPDHYERYLINYFRQAFQLQGTPIRLAFKQGENPFQGRKNPLTPRQVKKRKRLIRFVKSH